MEQNSLLGVLKSIFKWKKQIFFTCLIAGVGAVIISLLLPVYYEASTIFIVASPDQAKPELLFGEGSFDMDFYGDDADIDRVLTIAESKELNDYLTKKFDLYTHYDIDSTKEKAPYYVSLALSKHYDVKRTSKDAIELIIEDEDKETAAEMARSARMKIDEISQKLIKGSQSKAISTYETDITSKEALLRELGDTLASLRSQYNIYNVDAQTENLSEQYFKAQSKLAGSSSRLEALKTTPGIRRDTIAMLSAKIKGMEKQVDLFKEQVDLLNEGMGQVITYERQYSEATKSLGLDKERLKQYNAAFKSNIPALIIVEDAQTPVIKSRPKRKLLILGVIMVTFFFCIVGVLLLEAYKDVNWKEIYNAK
jgi:capsule polysaccharide export protein KpsE/RkpR